MIAEERSLPEGWVEATIGDVCDVCSGVGFPLQYQGNDRGEFPVYKVGDVSRAVRDCSGMLSKSENYIDDCVLSLLRGYVFPVGSTLFAKIGEAVRLNRRAFVLRPGLADNNVMGVVPEGVEPKFTHFFMKTVDLEDATRSTTVPSIRKSDIECIVIPLAPLAEQKVIADTLDVLLAQVDTIQARLDAIPVILKRFRQSVLSAAVTGKLTEDWRSKCPVGQSIHELPIQSKTRRGVPDTVKIPDGLALLKYPRSWALFSAAELLRKGVFIDLKDGNHGANHPKTADFTEYGLPFITAAQVMEKGTIDFDGAPKLSGSPLAILRVGFAKVGDVIFTHKGTVGRVAITSRDCILSPQTTYYRLDQKYVSADYLKYFLKSNVFIEQLDSVKSQTTRDFVPISTQYELFHLLPPLPEQHEIVRRVEALFAYADQIEARLQEATARVKHLTQSILAKAFRGELTADWRATHPELVTGENSAAALLERIRATRASGAEVNGKRIRTTTSESVSRTSIAAETAAVPRKRGRPRKG